MIFLWSLGLLFKLIQGSGQITYLLLNFVASWARGGSLSQSNYLTWKRSTFFYWVGWALKLHAAGPVSLSLSIVLCLFFVFLAISAALRLVFHPLILFNFIFGFHLAAHSELAFVDFPWGHARTVMSGQDKNKTWKWILPQKTIKCHKMTNWCIL